MNEEVRKILEMLESGKITAEQAERLISAIYEGEKRDKGERKKGFEGAVEDVVGKLVLDVISATFKAVGKGLKLAPFVPSEISEAFSEAGRGIGEAFKDLDEDLYIVEVISDNVVVSTSPDSHLKPGKYRKNNLIIPENSKLALKVVDGDAKLNGKFDRVICVVIDGNLEFEGWFNLLDLHIIDGDARIKTDIRDLKEGVKVLQGAKDIPELPGGGREIKGTIIDGNLKVISLDSSR
ncbi:MAG: hypothetical protein ABIL16_05935 [candidate division WOR-3 bacterium]